MKTILKLKKMLFSAVVLVAVGIASGQEIVNEIQPVRFLVLEVTPKGEATATGQPVRLRLAPHYGRISKQGLDFQFKNATQELTLVANIKKGYPIKRGDIIEFQVTRHLKLTPGSAVIRHLPSGEDEPVR